MRPPRTSWRGARRQRRSRKRSPSSRVPTRGSERTSAGAPSHAGCPEAGVQLYEAWGKPGKRPPISQRGQETESPTQVGLSRQVNLSLAGGNMKRVIAVVLVLVLALLLWWLWRHGTTEPRSRTLRDATAIQCRRKVTVGGESTVTDDKGRFTITGRGRPQSLGLEAVDPASRRSRGLPPRLEGHQA